MGSGTPSCARCCSVVGNCCFQHIKLKETRKSQTHPTMTFPDLFAVLRTQNYRQPCFQVLQSNSTSRSRHEQEHYTIANLDEMSLDNLSVHRMGIRRTQVDTHIYRLRYKHPVFNDVQEVNYWYIPYVLGTHCRIPIIEFQYRSWLPTHYHPTEIQMNVAELMDVFSVIQQERLEQIRRMEDGPRWQVPLISQYWGPDDHDDRITQDTSMFVGARTRRRSFVRTPTPPPPRQQRVIERIVERVVEVPVERVVV